MINAYMVPVMVVQSAYKKQGSIPSISFGHIFTAITINGNWARVPTADVIALSPMLNLSSKKHHSQE
jgi:hypothetical protein